MFFQRILRIGPESSSEKYPLFLYVIEFSFQSFKYCLAASHMFKGFQKKLIKIPVDQVIFVKKIAVKGLACQPAVLHDLTNSNVIDRGGLHTLFDGFGQSVFRSF